VQREANDDERMATSQELLASPIIMLDSISISRPFFPGRGNVIVQPVDSMALLQTGSLINDNVVQGYLNMLTHKAVSLNIELYTLTPQFYTVLSNHSWEGVDWWLWETKLTEAGWGTSHLIFLLPIFLGPHAYGHWTSLIADHTVLSPSGLLAFSDSLPANTAAQNSNQVSRALENTPLFRNGHTWVNTNMIDQAAGSNDCAVCMLLNFAAYLLAMRDAPGGNIEVPRPFSMILIYNRHLSTGEFGRMGQQHIYNSIWAGKINLDDKAIRDLKIQFT
jgi:hypothetical protein